MDVLTITEDFTSTVQAGRMFKAMILDAPNLIPKLLPQAIKSIQLFKHLKHRIDVVDTENFIYNYAVIEGDGELEKVQSISHELKVEHTTEGGCKVKNVSKYHPKPGVEIKEEDFKASREVPLAVVKVVDAYLVANPEAYA
ncbi:START-like domain superfamily [Sesbania bispinosa]|nr:START-like domain superfamily [Sesbania bispinosa]